MSTRTYDSPGARPIDAAFEPKYSTQVGNESPDPTQHPDAEPGRRDERTSVAILALMMGVVSFVSLFSCWIAPPVGFLMPVVFSLAAIALGIYTLRGIERGEYARVNRGFAIGGIVAGLLTPLTLLVLFLFVYPEGRDTSPSGIDHRVGGGPHQLYQERDARRDWAD